MKEQFSLHREAIRLLTEYADELEAEESVGGNILADPVAGIRSNTRGSIPLFLRKNYDARRCHEMLEYLGAINGYTAKVMVQYARERCNASKTAAILKRSETRTRNTINEGLFALQMAILLGK